MRLGVVKCTSVPVISAKTTEQGRWAGLPLFFLLGHGQVDDKSGTFTGLTGK